MVFQPQEYSFIYFFSQRSDCKNMNSSQKEESDCTNFSQSFNATQLSVQWSSDATDCLHWNIVHNETTMKIQILIVMLLLIFSLAVNVYLLFLGQWPMEALSWNPRSILFKNLIVSNLLLTLSVGLPTLYCLAFRESPSFGYKCEAQYFTVMLAIINSILTVTAMALERFLFICQVIHYLRIMTNMRMFCFMMLIWLLALTGAGMSTVLALMGGAKFGHIVAGFVCDPEVVQAHLEQSKYFETFNKVFIGSILFLCLLMFLLSYGRMYQNAQKMQQPFQQDNARARCTISVYFAIILLQLFPRTIKMFSSTIRGKDVDNQIYMLMLVLVPPCVNPLAYSIRHKEVRQALGRLCVWRKLKELFYG